MKVSAVPALYIFISSCRQANWIFIFNLFKLQQHALSESFFRSFNQSFIIICLRINSMRKSQPEVQAKYFKEYNYLHFDLSAHSAQTKTITHSVNFLSSQINSALPSAFVDALRTVELLYLFEWVHQPHAEVLLVKELKSNIFAKIVMNILPQTVVIADDWVFLLAGKQIFMASLLNESEQRMEMLEDADIISMDAIYTNKQEPGVSILYFKVKKGYFSKQYSKTQVKSNWLSFTKLLPTFKKYESFWKLKIILPNILAVAFKSANEFYLFDLNSMEIIESTKTVLNNWKLQQNPIIRWRSHKALAEFDDSMILAIGSGCSIEIFSFNIKKLEELNSFYQDEVFSIGSVARGEVIDWSRSQLSAYLVMHTDGCLIEDYYLTRGGLVYYSTQSKYCEVPYAKYVMFDMPFIENPILTQDVSIHRDYKNDITDRPNFTVDRLFIPNRYSHSFLQHLYSDKLSNLTSKQAEQDSKKLLLTWRKYYQFNHFIVFENDLIFVRRHSLSGIFQIDESQFHFQNYLETPKIDVAQNQASSFISLSSIGNNRLNEPIQFNGERHRPVITQIIYLQEKQQNEIENEKKNLKKQQFQQIIHEIDSIVEENIYPEIQSAGREFRREITINKLKDKINFYNFVLNDFQQVVFADCREKEIQHIERQRYIVHLINFFRTSMYHSEKVQKRCGKDILSLFIQQTKFEFSGDVERDIYFLSKKLWKNLLPLRVNQDINSEIYERNFDENEGLKENEFIEFLLTLHQQKQCVIKLEIEAYLSKMLRLGLLQNSANSFNLFWQNSSVLKAVFCVKMKAEEYKIIFSKYLLNQNERILINKARSNNELAEQALDQLLLLNELFHLRDFDAELFQSNIFQSFSNQKEPHQIKALISNMVETKLSCVKIIHESINCMNKLSSAGLLWTNSNLEEQLNHFKELKKIYEFELQKCKLYHEFEKKLEIQEFMLQLCTHQFNKKSLILSKMHPDQQLLAKLYLLEYLKQIESSLNRYRASFRKVYGADFWEGGDEDELLMSSDFLDGDISVLGHVCTGQWIGLIKKTFYDEKYEDVEDDFLDQKKSQKLSVFNKYDNADCLLYQLLKKTFEESEHGDQHSLYYDLRLLIQHFGQSKVNYCFHQNQKLNNLKKTLKPFLLAMLNINKETSQNVKDYASYRDPYAESMKA